MERTPAVSAAPSAAPDRLFTALARAELVTWTLLLAGMAGKYVLGFGDIGVRIGGGLHGFVFLGYCLVTVLVAVDQRWRLRDAALGLGSAVVPYATFGFERSVERRGLLAPAWRLLTDPPQGLLDRLVAAVVRRPAPAAVVLVVLIAAVFGGLLMLGPPTQWFA